MSHRNPEPLFTLARDNLIAYVSQNGVNGQSISFTLKPLIGVTNICQGRHRIIKEARDGNFTHILWLDDDMVFPANIIDILASRNLDAVGVNYVEKSPECRFVARDMQGKPLSSIGKTGVEPMLATGFGVFLMKLSILDNIPMPYFEMRWSEALQDDQTDDIFFFHKITSHGVKCYLDHDASQNIGHIGPYVYTLNSYAKS